MIYMFAFKVFTTTLIALLMLIIFFNGLKVTDNSTKMVSLIMFVIQSFAIIAIWG